MIKAKLAFIKHLGFNEEEGRKYGIESKALEDGRQQIFYNREAADGYVVDIDIPPVIRRTIKEILARMNSQKQIRDNLVTLYEKFM